MLDTRDEVDYPSQTNAGLAIYPPGGSHGPRIQRDYQLVALHTGSARVTVDGLALDIPTGHVRLLLPGAREYFAFAPERETRHSWIALPPRLLDDPTRAAFAALRPEQRLLPLSTALDACVTVGREVTAVESEPDLPVMTAFARAALALFLAEARAGLASGAAQRPALAQARELARRHACEGLTVGELARAVGLSQEHLIRLFHRAYGCTPGAFLQQTRLAQGMRLLEQSGLPVAEVARQSGFGSPQQFARSLRAATGASPTELRARSQMGARAAPARS